MANTTSTTVAGLIQAVIAQANARFHNNAAGMLATMNWIDSNTTSVDFPIYAQFAVSDVTATAEGTDFSTVTTVSAPATTLTIAENVQMVILSDTSVRAAGMNDNLVATTSAKLANNLSGALEKEVVTLFAGFDTTTVSGVDVGSALTLDNWFDAIAALVSAGADQNDLVAVLSPKQYYGTNGIRSELTDVNSGGPGTVAEELLQKGFVGTIAGIPVLVSNQIDQSGASASGGMYDSTQALGLASMGLFGIETQRDASLRGEEVVATGRWKAGLLLEALGVELVSKI